MALILAAAMRDQIEQDIGPYASVIVGLGGLGVLLILALALHSTNPKKFDVVIAAETIVVYGIANLILGLVSGVAMFYQGGFFSEGGFRAELIPRLSQPFLEGLLVAGIAPLSAAILRNLAIDQDGADGIDFELLRAESDNLTTSMKRAATQIDVLSGAAEQSSAVLNASITRAAEAADRFASDFTTKFDGIEDAVGELTKSVEGMASRLGTSVDQFAGLGENLKALKTKAAEAAEMLETLSAAIEKVERFAVRDRSGS
jgi:methyl-accepting chemotaxis protein